MAFEIGSMAVKFLKNADKMGISMLNYRTHKNTATNQIFTVFHSKQLRITSIEIT